MLKSLEHPDLIDAKFTGFCGGFCTKVLVDKISELGHEQEVQDFAFALMN